MSGEASERPSEPVSLSRTLRFPTEAVGKVFVMTEGAQPSQHEAQGEVEVPVGSKAFVILEEGHDPALPFLADVEHDVLAGLQAKALDAEGLARLARQTAVRQASVGTVDDAGLTALAGCSLETLEATLAGPAGDGVAALAALKALHLHGDPGAALGDLARSTSLTRLHVHLPQLTLEALRTLATSTHLEHLDVEVETVLEADDADVLDALVAVASGLKGLGATTEDGGSGLSTAVQVAVLRSSEELTLNGTTYTPAAVSRLERKLASA